MNQFVRNSLGAEFNFSQDPEMMYSVLMLIPDDNFISFSDKMLHFSCENQELCGKGVTFRQIR